MPKKKRGRASGDKLHGHFCKVCGEHKANEKITSKGHVAHICKNVPPCLLPTGTK